MTRVATAWLVYRLTHSAVLLGTVGFFGQIPTFLLAPLAGVLVDRWNRQRVLIATQALAMLQSLLLAWLALTGRITIAEILVLSAFQGCINAFDMPGRQSFMLEMVTDRADLSNAIAINSSMVNLARLVGPSLAGVLIAATSEGWCFLADGVSYLAVIASLLAMRIPRRSGPGPSKRGTSMLTELHEGFGYVRGFLPIRSILLLFALVSLMGWPFTVLMPIFAAKVLNGGAHTLGFLTSAVGIGALASGISLAMRRSVRGLLKRIPIGALVFGGGLMAFGLSRSLWLSMALLLLVGFGMMQGLTCSNTILQTIVPEDKRGRVMSYYTIAFVGMAPFGSLLAGTLAHAIGAPRTVMVSGAACLLGGLVFLAEMPKIRMELRPIYERLGILPSSGAPVPAGSTQA
jgi:MFS family permease